MSRTTADPDGIAAILDGPVAERSNADARDGIPMTGPEVRSILRDLEAGNPDRAAKRRLAGTAIRIGNLTAEGRALYARYAAALG